MYRRALRAAFAVLVAAPALAAPALKPEKKEVPGLAGTTWAGQTAEGWAMTLVFGADGSMTVSYKQTSFTTASWKQDGDTVSWEMNNRYCQFEGKLVGDAIEGESHNVTGKRWPTRMTRVAER